MEKVDRIFTDYFNKIEYPLDCNLEDVIDNFLAYTETSIDRSYIRNYIVDNVIQEKIIYLVDGDVNNDYCLNVNNKEECSDFLNKVDHEILIESLKAKNSKLIINYIQVRYLFDVFENIYLHGTKIDPITYKELKDLFRMRYFFSHQED